MNNIYPDFSALLRRRPAAYAKIRGSGNYPSINGIVKFYPTRHGTVVSAQIAGLPAPAAMCESPIFAFHIHAGGSCTGNVENPFADADGHYNPHDCPHPYHAGDMPPLFGADGMAFSTFLSNRFGVREIIGKTVIIHAHPDDFHTQPSGNAGEMIACGEIKAK